MRECGFGVIAQKVGDNQYAVIMGSQRVEATWYRTDYVSEFVVGDQVFVERVGGSGLWMISSAAFMNPGENPAQTNFLIWDVGRWNQKHWAP